jgi:hypothetical protein
MTQKNEERVSEEQAGDDGGGLLTQVQGLAPAFDNVWRISESRNPICGLVMNLKLELPGDLFDLQFSETEFAARVRELAILELVRVKRIHEHEAKQMLGLERCQLVEKMKAVGIAPTEEVFAGIQSELTKAIDSKRAREAGKSIKNAAPKRRG